jgi:hypothetical protein
MDLEYLLLSWHSLHLQNNTILTFWEAKLFEFWLKLYKKKYTIRLVIEYIFITNLFGDINISIVYYKLGQSWSHNCILLWTEGLYFFLFYMKWWMFFFQKKRYTTFFSFVGLFFVVHVIFLSRPRSNAAIYFENIYIIYYSWLDIDVLFSRSCNGWDLRLFLSCVRKYQVRSLMGRLLVSFFLFQVGPSRMSMSGLRRPWNWQ